MSLSMTNVTDESELTWLDRLITPEIEWAGVSAAIRFEDGDSRADLVRDVFDAMLRAVLLSPGPSAALAELLREYCGAVSPIDMANPWFDDLLNQRQAANTSYPLARR